MSLHTFAMISLVAGLFSVAGAIVSLLMTRRARRHYRQALAAVRSGRLEQMRGELAEAGERAERMLAELRAYQAEHGCPAALTYAEGLIRLLVVRTPGPGTRPGGHPRSRLNERAVAPRPGPPPGRVLSRRPAAG